MQCQEFQLAMTVQEIYQLSKDLKPEELTSEHAAQLLPLDNGHWNLLIGLLRRTAGGMDWLLQAAKLLTKEQLEIILIRNIKSKENLLSAVFASGNKKSVTEMLTLFQTLTPTAQANLLKSRIPCQASCDDKTILSIVIQSFSDEMKTIIPLIVRNKEMTLEEKNQLFDECWSYQSAQIIQLPSQQYFMFAHAYGALFWEQSVKDCIQDFNRICETISPSDTASVATTNRAVYENANIIFLKYFDSNKTKTDKGLFIKELTAFLEKAHTNDFFKQSLNRSDFSVLPQYLLEVLSIVGIPYRLYHAKRNALYNRSLFFPSSLETSMNRLQDTLHHQKPIEIPYSRWRSFAFLSSSIFLSSMILPNFDLGLGLAVVETIVSMAILYIKNHLEDQSSHSSFAFSEYGKQIFSSPLASCLTAPIAEELLFRGLIQNGLPLLISSFVPESSESRLFNLNSTAIFSLCFTSLLFGLMHLSNRHDKANVQAVATTISGLFYGWLALQSGIYCSIAAHIAHNTLLFLCADMAGFINDNKNENASSSLEECTEVDERLLTTRF